MLTLFQIDLTSALAADGLYPADTLYGYSFRISHARLPKPGQGYRVSLYPADTVVTAGYSVLWRAPRLYPAGYSLYLEAILRCQIILVREQRLYR